MFKPRGLYIILTKGDKLWRSDYTRERGLGFLEAVNCGEVNIWEKLMVDKGYLVRFAM